MKNLKELLKEMSEEEVKNLLFPENEYKPLWRFMQSKAGKKTIPNYDRMKWSERARALSEISGWTVDDRVLRTDFTRFDTLQRKKQQMM